MNPFAAPRTETPNLKYEALWTNADIAFSCFAMFITGLMAIGMGVLAVDAVAVWFRYDKSVLGWDWDCSWKDGRQVGLAVAGAILWFLTYFGFVTSLLNAPLGEGE